MIGIVFITVGAEIEKGVRDAFYSAAPLSSMLYML